MNFFEKAQARAHALEVLGLTGHPDPGEVRAAFKKLVKQKHPDQSGGADIEFLEIHSAYSLLKGDNGYTPADQLRPAPTDTGATTFRSDCKSGAVSPAPSRNDDDNDISSAYVSPRRVRSGFTSRVAKLDQSDVSECRSLLDEIPFMAEPDRDEISLRASILNVIESTGAPHVPHTNHLPYAIRKSGRRISYMVKSPIAKGVNRVAVPTGVYRDTRKVLPIIVRFKTNNDGTGTHVVSSSDLAASFPGARRVRIHFGFDQWPMAETEAACGWA